MLDEHQMNFAVMKFTNRMSAIVSRERYQLDKMAVNANVSASLYHTKVDHFNELVDALNTFVSRVMETDDVLFTPYDGGHSDSDASDPDIRHEGADAPNESFEPEDAADIDDAPETSYPQAEPEDGIDTSAGQQRAGAILSEYEQNAERDITTYSPADDEDPMLRDGYDDLSSDFDDEQDRADRHGDRDNSDDAVYDDSTQGELLSVDTSQEYHPDTKADDNHDDSQDQTGSQHHHASYAEDAINLPDDYKRPTESLGYLNHTADDIRVDEDPVQIAGVTTTVEHDGDEGREGHALDVSQYMSQNDDVPDSASDAISDDLDAYMNTGSDHSS